MEILNGSDQLIHEFDSFPHMLISRLNEQRLKTAMCDAKIITKEGAIFYAHKAVLAACSPYLEAELSSLGKSKENTEAVINLGMVSSISFQALLDLVYTAKLKLSPENVGEVLLAADILDLEEVGDICRQYLRAQIKSKSVTKDRASNSTSSNESDSSSDNNRRDENANDDSIVNSNDSTKYNSLKRRILREVVKPTKNNTRLASAPSSFSSNSDESGSERKRRKKCLSLNEESSLPQDQLSPTTSESSNDMDIFGVSNDNMLLSTDKDSDSELEHVDVMSSSPKEEDMHDRTQVQIPSQLPNQKIENNQMDISKHFHRFTDGDMNNNNTPTTSTTQDVTLQNQQTLIKSLYFLQSRANALPMFSKAEYNAPYTHMLQSAPNMNQTAHMSRFTCAHCRVDLGNEWSYSMHQRLYHQQYHTDYMLARRDAQIVPQRSHSFSARTEISPVPIPRMLLKEKPILAPSMPHPIIEFAKGNSTNKTDNNNSLHRCYHCNKDFNTVFELRKHKANEHVKRPFKCDVCQAAFPNKAGLSVHVRSHTGERPYKCKVCNKAFTQLGHVQRHQKVHTGEKPYQCPLCHARVRDKASMHYHILAHKGVKPFKCDQCDARFTKRSSLVKHKNVHTGDFLYQCSQCKASFREKASLSRHARSQHKEHVFMQHPEQPFTNETTAVSNGAC